MRNGKELTRAALRKFPIPTVTSGDKDSRGKLLIVAGSNQTPGSAVLCAQAALRSGAGKVTIATADSAALHIAMQVPEAKLIALAPGRGGGFARSALRDLAGRADEYDAVVAGPGMEPGRHCADLAAALLETDRPTVLDAAILYELQCLREAVRKAAPTILPHDREMAALLGCEPEAVNADPLKCGQDCVRKYGALTLVKGAESHVLAPDGRIWTHRGGAPGLGVSGSGDTLAGIVGGLAARGGGPLAALLWAVLLHGEAGDALSRKVGPVGFFASEIPGEIPALLAR